jgi:Ca2+-binding EF-hand superfamily protein
VYSSTSEAIELAFGLFDHQRQGSFSCDEFVAAMRQCLPHEDGDEAWVELFSRLDADADGIFTIGQWVCFSYLFCFALHL